MQEYTVARTGLPVLKFNGTMLARADGESRDQNRWHDLTVYRTEGGTYVVVIGYCSNWKDELGHVYAGTCKDATAVHAVLAFYNPTAHIAGYPPGDHYAEKQTRLEADLTRRYLALSTEIYEQLGAEFAEVIP